MQEAGISVFGYVATGWGENDISSLEADILAYHNWYSVNGTYLDQMPNWNYNGPNGTWYYSGPGGVFLPGYMSNLTAYAKSLGMTKVFANSGADIPTDFVGTVDTIGIFENSFTPSIYGYPSLAGATNWHADYNKNNFMFFSYNTTSIDPYYLMTASDYVGYLFVTNGVLPLPYDSLPPYFDQMVSDLASMVPIAVGAEAVNGSTLKGGVQVTVTQSDGTANTLVSSSTFDVLSGSTVKIAVATNDTGYVFDHWSDGSTSPVISVTPTQAMTLVAYFRSSTPTKIPVTVETTSTAGVPIAGLWTEIQTNGTLVAAGPTPFTFEATEGMNYSVSVPNYQGYSFVHWSDGSDRSLISITPDQVTSLDAYFNKVSQGTLTNTTSSTTSKTSAASSSENVTIPSSSTTSSIITSSSMVSTSTTSQPQSVVLAVAGLFAAAGVAVLSYIVLGQIHPRRKSA